MTTTATRRRYGGKSADERRRERREALVAAGLAIWQEQGWAAVTMRGVCSRAGLTDRYFYESFRDRDDLLAVLFDHVRDGSLERMGAAILEVADQHPLVHVRAAMSAILHEIVDDPARAQILFGDHAGSAVLEQRRRDAVQVATDLMIELARPYLRDGVDETSIRIHTLLGIGGFVEVVMAWRAGQLAVDTDGLLDHLDGVAASLAARFLD
mgnify:CR=1 FL=1